jgi:formate/nitrite transporter FocA (FNT family)
LSQEPEQGTRLSAVEIHRNLLEPAEHEIRRPAAALFWSALASGMVIGFSCLASAFGASVAPDAYVHLAASVGYPLGFIFVIMARSELFTENTLVPVIPFLERRDSETFRRLIRVWGLLLAGNLLGALIFGFALARSSVVEPSVAAELLRISREATTGGFGTVLYSAVFGGWLIALLAWLLASTRSTTAQILLIWLCTFPIAALKFRHSIAGSVEAFYLAWLGDASWGPMLGEFVTPAVIGNAIGGVLLVGLLNYTQVAAERDG